MQRQDGGMPRKMGRACWSSRGAGPADGGRDIGVMVTGFVSMRVEDLGVKVEDLGAPLSCWSVRVLTVAEPEGVACKATHLRRVSGVEPRLGHGPACFVANIVAVCTMESLGPCWVLTAATKYRERAE
jgi:hypothetical protein